MKNYAQVVEAKDEKTGRKKRTQIWPRDPQLDVVRRLLARRRARGGPALPDLALGGQRQEQLHRLACPPTDPEGGR